MKSKMLLFVLAAFFGMASFAQSSKQVAVEKAVAELTKAMVEADSVALDRLTLSELTYGHSGGTIENKQEFISKITSGKSDFLTIDLADQSVAIVNNTAIVRHLLNATTNDSGKPGEVHLKVLLVLQLQHGEWKLLARQAVKPH